MCIIHITVYTLYTYRVQCYKCYPYNMLFLTTFFILLLLFYLLSTPHFIFLSFIFSLVKKLNMLIYISFTCLVKLFTPLGNVFRNFYVLHLYYITRTLSFLLYRHMLFLTSLAKLLAHIFRIPVDNKVSYFLSTIVNEVY